MGSLRLAQYLFLTFYTKLAEDTLLVFSLLHDVVSAYLSNWQNHKIRRGEGMLATKKAQFAKIRD